MTFSKRNMHRAQLLLLFLSVGVFTGFAAEKKKCALLPFKPSVVTTAEASLVGDRIFSELEKTGYFELISRSRMKEIMKEQDLAQSSFCDDTACAVEIGKLASAEYIIYGSVGKFEDAYLLNAFLVSIETGKIIETGSAFHSNTKDLILVGLPAVVVQLLGNEGNSPPPPDVPDRPAPPEGIAPMHPSLPAEGMPRVEVSLPADLANAKAHSPATVTGLAPGSELALQRQQQDAERYKLPLEVQARRSAIRFRLLPSGSFEMGSRSAEKGHEDHEAPPHRVTLATPFYMGKGEITLAQWVTFMGVRPKKMSGHYADDHPVYNVSYADALDFCKKLCLAEGVTPGSYRLPTEAEWEYACRAGTSTPYYSGDTQEALGRAGWYASNTRVIQAGCGKLPNAFGLCDMHGNLAEWVGDWFAPYRPADNVNPTGPTQGDYRIVRGGNWKYTSAFCRSAKRTRKGEDAKSFLVGFRIVRDLQVR